LALKHKRIEFAKYLLRLPDIDVTICSKKYGSSLHLALNAHQFKLAMTIIKQGIKMPNKNKESIVNSRDELGNTPLHLVFQNLGVCSPFDFSDSQAAVSFTSSNTNNHTPGRTID
jgi:ankyrin repeat protein